MFSLANADDADTPEIAAKADSASTKVTIFGSSPCLCDDLIVSSVDAIEAPIRGRSPPPLRLTGREPCVRLLDVALSWGRAPDRYEAATRKKAEIGEFKATSAHDIGSENQFLGAQNHRYRYHAYWRQEFRSSGSGIYVGDWFRKVRYCDDNQIDNQNENLMYLGSREAKYSSRRANLLEKHCIRSAYTVNQAICETHSLQSSRLMA